MITKDQILAAGAAALTSAFHDWLNENREPILQIVAEALAQSDQGKPRGAIIPARPERPYLTVAEVATRWKCCVHTVHRKIRAGALQSMVLSQRHILVALQEVLRFEKDTSCAGRK